MMGFLRHAYRVGQSVLREHAKRVDRSPQWRAVEERWKRSHPTCAACGGASMIQVHHKEPFHLHPEMELLESNLISLCMSGLEDHIRIGHGDDFKMYNPTVELDAAAVKAHPEQRAAIEAKAKAGRLSV